MKFIFFNENDRLRSGWRALIFFVTFFLLAGAFILAATLLLAGLPIGPSVGSYLPLTIPFAISSIIAIILGWVYGKFFEGLPFRALGCSFRAKWLSHFAAGGIVGAIAIGCAVIIAVMGGGLKLSLNHDSSSSAIWSTLSITLVVFLVGALSEETLFRGYILQTLTRADQIIAGVAITSLLFALAHTGNPEVGWLAIFNTLLAGIWFAVAYLKDKRSVVPVGDPFDLELDARACSGDQRERNRRPESGSGHENNGCRAGLADRRQLRHRGRSGVHLSRSFYLPSWSICFRGRDQRLRCWH